MDTKSYLQVPDQSADTMDKYTASIELSNACRQFYKSRVEAANCIKSRWESHHRPSNDNDRPADDSTNTTASKNTTTTTSTTNTTPRRQRNSIDEAMDKLRTEMSSLMEQDLSLMKQLLTLNETIEELKWQRRYYYSRRSLPGSSTDIDHSDCSLSDAEMYDSEDDSSALDTSGDAATATASPTCQTPAILLTCPSSSSSSSSASSCSSSSGCSSSSSSRKDKKSPDTQKLVPGSIVKVHSEKASKPFNEKSSFDSGIHEQSSEEEAAV